MPVVTLFFKTIRAFVIVHRESRHSGRSEWRPNKIYSLLLDKMAQASGRNKADLLGQYNKFDQI